MVNGLALIFVSCLVLRTQEEVLGFWSLIVK